MRICYIGHEYHRKTASTNFMADLLESQAEYYKRHDMLPDPASVEAFDFDALAAENFDIICVFQIEHVARRIAEAKLGARLIFIPMYDGCRLLGDGYWASFAGRDDVRVINFSSTLHRYLMDLGVSSFRFQYFPEPARDFTKPAEGQVPEQAFFWQRTDRPSWEVVKTLLGNAPDLKVHLHLAGDPSLKAAVDLEAEKAERDITVSTWFEDPSEYLEIVNRSDIYIAPREFEGIGMSFLEAMAAGKCVIAPNRPTMSEYIVHGVNGYLYDIDAPEALDLSRAPRIGQMAGLYMQHGHRVWAQDFATRMRDVLFKDDLDNPDSYRETDSYVWRADKPNPEAFTSLGSDKWPMPKVSVGVVCYNAEAELPATLETILAQTYANMEVVVVDGASTDSTPDILEQYRDRLDVCVSEPDKGVYDAMGKVGRLATGDYVIFMNAGDFFHLPTSLEETMMNVFGPGVPVVRDELPDFVHGNHIYVHTSGATDLHRSNRFEDTWDQLQTGRMRPDWWSGIPGHQATLTRRDLLNAHGFDPSFKITADHNLMFKTRAQGARFAHSASTVARYVGGGLSQQRNEECIRESFRVSLSVTSQPEAVHAFYKRNFGQYAVVANIEELRANIDALRASGLFNEDWYRMRYMHGETGDPIEQYLLEGRFTGNWPSPFFNPQHYLSVNLDVQAAGVDPFLHYVKHGIAECRATYNWDDANAPLSRLKGLFSWHQDNLADIEKKLANAEPNDLLARLRQ